MSYTPYPSGSAATRDRGVWRWRWLKIFLVFLCVAPPALYYWWRFKPVRSEEPLAKVLLSGGNELRLVATQHGARLEIDEEENFSGRVVWDDRNGYRNAKHVVEVDSPRAAWMIFSLFDSDRGTFAAPQFSYFEIEDEGGAIFQGDVGRFRGNSGSTPPVAAVVFKILPRRSEMLKVRFGVGSHVGEATLRNPFRDTEAAPFTAKPLPQVEVVDEVEFRLEAVTFSQRPGQGSRPTVNYDMKPRLSAKLIGMEKYPPQISWTIFDPTGNESPYYALPMGDRVWGARMTAREPLNYPFPENQRLALAKIPIPSPQQGVKVQLPPELQATGLVDMFILGSGTFHWNNGKLMAANAVSGTAVELGRIAINSPGNWNSDALSILLVEGPRSKQKNERSLLVRANGEDLQSSMSSGFGAGDGTMTQLFSRYRAAKNRVPQPGENLEVVMVFPKERTATFYFEHPPLPAAPATPNRP